MADQIAIGAKIRFKREGDWCEGEFTVTGIDFQAKTLTLSPTLPNGIAPGDDMVVMLNG
jgi:hypothetical protein